MSANEDAKPHKEYEILVNGTLAEVDDQTVTYEQLVETAFPNSDPNVVYTVTYRKAAGPHGDGSLVAGQSVEVKKKGTSFDVVPTVKS